MYFEDARLEFFGGYLSRGCPTCRCLTSPRNERAGFSPPRSHTDRISVMRWRRPTIGHLPRIMTLPSRRWSPPNRGRCCKPSGVNACLLAPIRFEPQGFSNSTNRPCSAPAIFPAIGISAAASNPGAIQNHRQMGLWLGWHTRFRPRLFPGLRTAPKPAGRQSACSTPDNIVSNKLTSKVAASGAFSTRARCISMDLLALTANGKFPSFIPSLTTTTRQINRFWRGTQPSQQFDKPVPRRRILSAGQCDGGRDRSVHTR